MANEEWESTRGEGSIWNPTVDENGDKKTVKAEWSDEEAEFKDGYYLDTKFDVGPNSSQLHKFQDADGEIFNVWGSKSINEEIAKIRPGEFLRLKWHGFFPTKAGALSGKQLAKLGTKETFHKWEIFRSKSVKPLDIRDTRTQASPSGNNSTTTGSANASKANGGNGIAKSVKDESDDLPF